MKRKGCSAETLEAILDGRVRAVEMSGDRGEGFPRADAAEYLVEVYGSLGEVVDVEGGGRKGFMAGAAAKSRNPALTGGDKGSKTAIERKRGFRASIMAMMHTGRIRAEWRNKGSYHIKDTSKIFTGASAKYAIYLIFLPLSKLSI